MDVATDLAMALDPATFARSLGVAPDPWQERLLRSPANRALLNCCRQSGKSTVGGLIALHRALYHPGSLVLVLAPTLRQSQELFTKIEDFYGLSKHAVPPRADRRLSLELENGSRIVTLPGTEKTVRGFSGASLLIVDEAARVDDALYYSVRPMLAVSGGALMMLSTPFGKRGVFYREWTDGQGWERYEVKAAECPRISSAFIEEERRNMPNPWFRQEYLCEFVEASGAVFSHDDVRAALDSSVRPLLQRR
jgi:hypothetical protein